MYTEGAAWGDAELRVTLPSDFGLTAMHCKEKPSGGAALLRN